MCGSSERQRQSVRARKTNRVKAKGVKSKHKQTWSSGGVAFFLPVEIWLWLQPPSSSHETRGSRTLHLWGYINTSVSSNAILVIKNIHQTIKLNFNVHIGKQILSSRTQCTKHTSLIECFSTFYFLAQSYMRKCFSLSVKLVKFEHKIQ